MLNFFYIIDSFLMQKEQKYYAFLLRRCAVAVLLFSLFKMCYILLSESMLLESSCKTSSRLVCKEHKKGKDDNNIFPKKFFLVCAL